MREYAGELTTHVRLPLNDVGWIFIFSCCPVRYILLAMLSDFCYSTYCLLMLNYLLDFRTQTTLMTLKIAMP